MEILPGRLYKDGIPKCCILAHFKRLEYDIKKQVHDIVVQRSMMKALKNNMPKIMLLILLSVLIEPVFAESPKAPSEAIKGKSLHAQILARYPKLDKFYRQPDLYGALTTSPKVTIYIPIVDWEKLTSKDRNLLSAYAASLIKIVQSNPLKYARVPSHAPAASTIENNAARMTDSSWQIIAGQFANNGRDMMADSTVQSGH
ncbi:MAG: hypothetical protein AB1442_01495 [Nitrospirota bacterium]